MKTNKAVGLDKIDARLLKDSVDVITPSLTNLEIIVNFNKIDARLLKDSVDVITPSLTNLEIIVNFNKMLETLIFQRSYAQYLY